MAKKRVNKFMNTTRFAYVDPKKVTNLVQNFSDIGIDFKIISQRNSRAISNEEEEIYSILSNSTSLLDEESPYFDKRFDEKVEFLQMFAQHNEIEYITETICNDAIVNDSFGYFCSLDSKKIKIPDEIQKRLELNFKKIYNLFGWDDGTKAWEDFYEFLTVGYGTFEIIYQYKTRKELDDEKKEKQDKLNRLIANISESVGDEKKKLQYLTESKRIQDEIMDTNNKINFGKQISKKPRDKDWYEENSIKYREQQDDLIPVSIIGMKAIPHNSVLSLEWMDKATGRIIKLWKYDKGDSDYTILSDYEIMQISYSKIPGNKQKFSYLERLIRNFNLTRKLEESRVGWNILNSQFRMHIVVPIGTKVSSKAKQALRQVADRYKEEISINERSGEISLNGTAKLNFGRTYVTPSRPGGGEPKVESINWTGPDLTNMDVVEYFRKNMWRDSYLPQNRFDRSGNVGALSLFRSEGVPYDEISYNHFINRLQNEFSKLLKTPLYIQTLLEFPSLKIDQEFKSKLGFHHNTTSYFEDAKEAEIANAKLTNIQTLLGAMQPDGTTPIYSARYLYVEKYKLLTPEEWESNVKEVAKEQEAKKKAEGDGGLPAI